LEAIRRTGRKPEEILFVDDSLSNVEAAKKAGMNADLYIPGHDLRALIEAWL
ncbi:MAG: HAD-IA family hydrolase, partial [Bacteroidales bacterium]|nr:HAD-IA family hydrolase [Bacteroidales bacterium]